MVIVKFESRLDVGWYNRTGKKGWLCLVIARETRFDIAGMVGEGVERKQLNVEGGQVWNKNRHLKIVGN